MHTKFCLCPPILESLFPLVLWKSCSQFPLAFKPRFPGDSQSLCQIPSLGSLMWDPKHSQQLGNIFGINVLLLVSHPSSGYEIWFYHDSALPLPTISLWFLLCLWMWDIFFWGGGVQFWHPPINHCSTASCKFVLSQEEMSMCPSALPPWTRSEPICYFYCWETVQSMNIPQFVNSFPYWLAFDCFQFRTLHVKLLSTFAKKIDIMCLLPDFCSTSLTYLSALYQGFPSWLSWQRIHLQCGRPGFDLWVGKIPWGREWLPTPVFWPGEFHGLYSPWGHKESDLTERLPLSSYTKKCSS